MRIAEYEEKIDIYTFMKQIQTERLVRPVQVYEAVVADGYPTKSGRIYSRADFARARKSFFEIRPEQGYVKSPDQLLITIPERYREDGSPVRDFTAFHVIDLWLNDHTDGWSASIRFVPYKPPYSSNPMMELIEGCHNTLHEKRVQIVPVGDGELFEHEGQMKVRGFRLISFSLVPDSNFTRAKVEKVA